MKPNGELVYDQYSGKVIEIVSVGRANNKLLLLVATFSIVGGSPSIFAQSISEGQNEIKRYCAEIVIRSNQYTNDDIEGHKDWLASLARFARADDYYLDLAAKVATESSGIHLSGKRLNVKRRTIDEAVFTGADLRYSSIQQSNLDHADFRCANLHKANLTLSKLRKADMTGAVLSNTLFVGADLEGANLTGANLGGSNLTGASLKETNLEGADFRGVVLANTIYEPLLGANPKFSVLVSSEGLESVRFESHAHGLQELRRKFREAGYGQQERQLTYAIRRSEWEKLKSEGQWIEAWFNRIFFDIPVAYGLNPGRAIQVLLFGVILFSIPYSLVLSSMKFSFDARIWRICPPDSLLRHHDNREPEHLKIAFPKCLLFGLYFSLLSAFHIGWRDLNVGNWLVRLQPKEYLLLATGWVRTVSGIQSLISVYLLAIWILTWFGRPFG